MYIVKTLHTNGIQDYCYIGDRATVLRIEGIDVPVAFIDITLHLRPHMTVVIHKYYGEMPVAEGIIFPLAWLTNIDEG